MHFLTNVEKDRLCYATYFIKYIPIWQTKTLESENLIRNKELHVIRHTIKKIY